MIIVVDEDLPRSLTARLQSLSLEVADVRDVGLRGKTDREILDYCSDNGALLITGDLDFSKFFRFTRMLHAGTIIVRYPSSISTEIMIEEVGILFSKTEPESFKGRITILEPGLKVRWRKTFPG